LSVVRKKQMREDALAGKGMIMECGKNREGRGLKPARQGLKDRRRIKVSGQV
jgi:hypothetical protein